MFLIDKPYVSEFLINTIKKNNFKIVATPIAKEMVNDNSLNWITETEAKQIFSKDQSTPIYSNSENTISWVEQNLSSSNIPKHIEVFKNKIKFREMLQDSFPDYFFKGIKFDALDSLSVESIPFPFIIKPAIGFFSLGVHKVDNQFEWPEVLATIKEEISKIKGYYPNEVLNTKYFIIEECIKGEEYAVDCYFNNEEEPTVLNIMHHIFSSGKDVSDRIYTTSKEIIEQHKDGIESFLQLIGKKAHLKNFPVHVEIRIDELGVIKPIEVNPMRFGGWCTTGDLAWYAFGINSYEYFLNNKKPNWNEILESRKDKNYSIVLLDNNSGISNTDITSFNYEKVLNDFEKPLNLRKVDFNEYPIFGILFTETTKGNEIELDNILSSNLKQYISTN